jgi:hypothetical protein
MSTNGDHEMADASVGADVNDAEVELVEPQRIRVVSFIFVLFFSTQVLSLSPIVTNSATNGKHTYKSKSDIKKNSCLDRPTLPLLSNSPKKTTLLETLYDTSS